MSKFFRATHKETGEQIEFGIEEIYIDYYDISSPQDLMIGSKWIETMFMKNWLEDYDLEYNHKGEWFKYE